MRLLVWDFTRRAVRCQPVIDATTKDDGTGRVLGGPHFDRRDDTWGLAWHLPGAQMYLQMNDAEARAVLEVMQDKLTPEETPMDPDTSPDTPAKPYTIWLDYGSEGWHPSEPQASILDCFNYMRDRAHCGAYRITRDVAFEVREVQG
ncbi:hypothetical protein SEA_PHRAPPUCCINO_156 [Mycobacterium phage Phrappuccino]|uniref:Uncharacterized protein n=1 Tax=Mycobacterium phage Phrappuccino TaxID=2591223 RepID=A0A514DDY7_9CAUD|nr:hypothetical protein KHQ87_gp156 [Mycobacterium phage Phrappuccino]QDH91831.1 hypothetical protein SEA_PHRAPPUCCINO_156 [Mycobacterium phage Phrappuccino]QIQ63273.1 hypothetical protein SEA_SETTECANDELA_156 [Mycobacterium phage Settecandela]